MIITSHTGRIHENPGYRAEMRGAEVANQYYAKMAWMGGTDILRSADLLYRHWNGSAFAHGFREAATHIAHVVTANDPTPRVLKGLEPTAGLGHGIGLQPTTRLRGY